MGQVAAETPSWRWLVRPAAWPLALPLVAAVTMILPAAQRSVGLNLVILVMLIGTTAALLGRTRAFPAEATAWRWYAAAFALFVLLYLGFALRGLFGVEPPWDISTLTIPATICQVIGLLCLPVPPIRMGQRLRIVMDALTFSLGVVCLQWLGGVAELGTQATLSLGELVSALAPYAVLAATMGVIVYLAGARPERYFGVLGLLSVGEIIGTVNNLGALTLVSHGAYAEGHPIDLLAPLSLAFTAAAALWPRGVDEGRAHPGVLRLATYLPYLPVTAVLAVLLVQHAAGRLGPAAGVLWLVYPLLGMVLLRQYLTIIDLRRLSTTLEAQVERRTRALAQARDQLLGARRLEALGRLAGGVAHDFNDLLTGIGGHAHMIARRLPAGDASVEYAVEVQRAVERGAGLTRQILTFARRQAGEPRIFAAGELLSGLERLLGRLVDERTELSVHADAQDARVRMDPGQLEQVIVNLVINARDAMPGGGRIEVRATLVDVPAGEAAPHGCAPGRYVALAVADSGEGMSPEVRARVFEPFFTTKSPGKGTGLGLATSYGIVRQAGGFFTVTSEPSLGSTFVVHLPVTREAATIANELTPAPVPGAGRVLLVDASPLLRATLAEALRAGGFEVRDAATGADAAELLKSGTGAIDVLVTDALVPGIDVRTILTTSAHELPDAALPAHVALLAKPFLPDELLRKIGRAMEPS